jgi:hypothetical protein
MRTHSTFQMCATRSTVLGILCVHGSTVGTHYCALLLNLLQLLRCLNVGCFPYPLTLAEVSALSSFIGHNNTF